MDARIRPLQHLRMLRVRCVDIALFSISLQVMCCLRLPTLYASKRGADMKHCVGAGLSIVASDEVDRPCTQGVQLKCRGATGVKLKRTQASTAAAQVPSWSLAGARAPERVGTEPTLLEIEVSYKGVPVPELTFALKVCARPLPAAKYGLQVAGGGAAMPVALTLRVTRQDAFGNVLVGDMSDAELPVVGVEAEGEDGEVFLGTGGAAPAVAGGKARWELPLPNLGTGLTCVSL